MLIRRTSILTGRIHDREIAVTRNQIDRWRAGELIQNVMPHLSAEDREFIMTGITPTEWGEHFGSDDDQVGEPE